MSDIDFDALATDADWQQALATLVANAADACRPGATAADREAARGDLRDFRNYPCPFEDMRRTALEALNDLTLADINQALHSLQDLQKQLNKDKKGFAVARVAAAAPPSQLRRARVAIEALHAYTGELPGLAEQLNALQASIDQLLKKHS
jgi:hypothetical protein